MAAVPPIELVDHDAPPVAYRQAGSGDLMVFLHGLGTTRTSWDAQLLEFAVDHHCVAWDMPGYGASPPPAGPLDWAVTTEAIAGLLDRFGADRAHLVGLSFGGMHALHFALAAPERVRSLVLCDTSPAFGLDGTSVADWSAARLAPLDDGATPADIAPAVMAAISGPDFSGAGLATAVESMSRISAAGLRAAVRCLPTHDVRTRLPSIAAPTLVVVGEHDRETPLAYSEMLAASIANAQLAIVAEVGHVTPLEDPTGFNRLVRDFLSSLPSNQSEHS